MNDATIPAPTQASPATCNCPVCEAEIALPSDALQGEIVPCDDCGAELELLTVTPPTLGEAPEVGEDWGE